VGLNSNQGVNSKIDLAGAMKKLFA
jgi:hypothetical protein